MATREEQLKELNKKCMECQKAGKANFDKCNYYCQIGKKIHRLDVGTGWGSHKHWN